MYVYDPDDVFRGQSCLRAFICDIEDKDAQFKRILVTGGAGFLGAREGEDVSTGFGLCRTRR